MKVEWKGNNTLKLSSESLTHPTNKLNDMTFVLGVMGNVIGNFGLQKWKNKNINDMRAIK